MHFVAASAHLSGLVKRREVKSKGEKERYKHLNAEFQRIARKDKKAFFSDQCKEIEENNKMGKTKDLFKKIRDTKGAFHAKMGSIKDRNVRDLKEMKTFIYAKTCMFYILSSIIPNSQNLERFQMSINGDRINKT